MTEIPEDVMKLANEAMCDGNVLRGNVVENAARAILAAQEAQRERDAKACEVQAQVFLSPEYATGQPLSSFQERFACERCAAAIRKG